MDSPVSPGITTGTVVGGRYAVDSLLGRGGMATVYRATDTALGRNVALKLFSANEEGAAGLGRETSEIRLLASLNHHALVTLFDASVDTDATVDQPYLVMELVEGPTLKERIDSAPIAPTDVALMVSELAEALHVVHAGGVVHRDIKPANILLSTSASTAFEFRAKLSDFGIAYLIDSTRLTTPGTIIGTAAYLSPEQARGVAPGAASDIYSLGLVTLEALTGARAFPGSMVETLSARIVSDPVIPASVGLEWRSLLAAMTTREPADRPTALEVADRARGIERSLHSVEPTGDVATAQLGATAAMGATEALGATAALGATSTLGATAAHDATDARVIAPEPTRVLRAEADPTELLVAPSAAPTDARAVAPDRSATSTATATSASTSTSTDAAPGRARRAIPRRLIAAVAAGLVVIAAVVAGITLTTQQQQQQAPAEVPTLPDNEGVLGTHLDELLESVTP
jgi:hypothetical protein